MAATIPAPGRHGGDGAAVAAALGLDVADFVDLSATLNPFAPDVAPLLARHADAVRRYPDDRAATEALADALGVPVDHVLITNGGSEAISLVAQELGGRVASEPEFSLHPRGTSGPVWRSNPHSPTGLLAAPTDVADVWDEAFYPLSTGSWTAARSGVVVVGSVTKLFACPGLRLGYIVSDDVERFRRHQPEWPVSTLALAVLVDLLGSADLVGWAAGIEHHRALLRALLLEHGLQPEHSEAPWVLVPSPGLRERLAPHGVVVRDCTSFGLPGVSRIAVPGVDGLARLADALERSSS